MVFVPKHLQQWKPANHSHKRCHWCTRGPLSVGKMLIVLESPMRWYFCTEGCCDKWQARRHDGDVIEWLKFGRGERAHVLKQVRDENETPATDCGRCFARLRVDSHLSLSMPDDH